MRLHVVQVDVISAGRRVLAALAGLAVAAASLSSRATAAPRADGRLELSIVDAETAEPLAARVHLKNTRGRPVLLGLPGSSQYGDHFYVDGRIALPLRVGQYTLEIEATPEYRTITSEPFEIERHADDSKQVEMPRFAKLEQEGWWAGDSDVSRPPSELPLAMRAEGLCVVLDRVPTGRAPRGSRRNPAAGDAINGGLAHSDANRVVRTSAVLDERFGGGLLLVDVDPPLDLSRATPYWPSSLSVLREARGRGGRVVARTPFAWDLPVWLASGELDAIQLIHHHSLRNDVADQEDDGRPRDRSLFPGVRGNGRWSEAVYYHVLNCGLRIPPTAGSGSGSNVSPVGNNRVYAYCGPEFGYDRWWDALAAGRVFVTNGPLLRPLVQGKPPGHVFSLRGGQTLSLQIGLQLATRVPVDYLQIVKNGRVEAEARLADWKGQIGRLPPVAFDDSGWFLVRAVTRNRQNYQFASSGPYYVQRDGSERISRTSVEFFLAWIDAACERIKAADDLQPADRAALLAEQQSAREFFQALLAKAHAD